jgi:hypothetical protein
MTWKIILHITTATSAKYVRGAKSKKIKTEGIKVRVLKHEE